jgi:Holliday junction resolvasome RuvABC endonuclease subunit
VPKPKGATRVLALDQATKVTGYSIFDDGKLVKYGTFHTTSDDEIARCASVKNWFLSMLQNWRPDYVGIEGIQYQPKVFDGDTVGSVTLFQTLAHLQGVLLITCHEQDVPCKICPTNTWRNVCGVKGRARADKKKSMQLIAKDWYGITATDDETDAIGIGYYMTTVVNKNTSVTNWEI